jgi:hypothetical protein
MGLILIEDKVKFWALVNMGNTHLDSINVGCFLTI